MYKNIRIYSVNIPFGIVVAHVLDKILNGRFLSLDIYY